MAAGKKGLGRGLDALLADNVTDPADESSEVVSKVRTYDIEPNRNQPRKHFDAQALEELAASIGQHGLIQPIVVRRKQNGFYEIIAGERRWRAAKMAGLNEVPVVVKELSDKDAAFLSMVENLQREDLNPVEEARGYKTLIENFGLTQEEAAEKVGKSRANVANFLRLLKLPNGVLSLVEGSRLSYGHARAIIPLLTVFADAEVVAYAEKIAERQLSVRETESFINELTSRKEPAKDDKVKQSYFKELERRASDRLGRKVKLSGKTVTIAYKGNDDLENLLSSLCGDDVFNDENRE